MLPYRFTFQTGDCTGKCGKFWIILKRNGNYMEIAVSVCGNIVALETRRESGRFWNFPTLTSTHRTKVSELVYLAGVIGATCLTVPKMYKKKKLFPHFNRLIIASTKQLPVRTLFQEYIIFNNQYFR